jgi:hypothetical protein
LEEHAEQTPLMQARPGSELGKLGALQSSNDVQRPHVPLMHACSLLHWLSPALQLLALPADEQMPPLQVSPLAQSSFCEQVHWMPVWVAAHLALGPH